MKPNFNKFKKLTDPSQLKEGMVLIDNHMHRRTVLALNDNRIWLSHKGGYKRINRFTGKEHLIEDFFRNYKNWIFSE